MTNTEFYTRAENIIDDYMKTVSITNHTNAYVGAVAAHIGIILVECKTNHVPPSEFLFIIRLHFSYRTNYKSNIKEAYRYFYREFKAITLDLENDLPNTVQTRRKQGYNTYE